MGLHKLEIELSDELMEKIERISENTNSSVSEVVAEAITTLQENRDGDLAAIARRRAFLDAIFDRVSNAGQGRSQEDIDRQVREFRADRDYR